jgi:phytoene dehydrogenase-like protein
LTAAPLNAKACVIGSGPNGLAAAIALAQHGIAVDVFESEALPGGAARTMELTLPGFQHDFGSAVHPLGAASPFFQSLPLAQYGLEWIESPSVLAHPLDDGTAVLLERDLDAFCNSLGADGPAWKSLVLPVVEHWQQLGPQLLGPVSLLPRHPFRMAAFGLHSLPSANWLVRRFRSPRTRALFAGLAAHSFLSLDQPLSAGFGLMLAIIAHVAGWPIPRGGSQSLTTALCRHLESLGGTVHTSHPVTSLNDLQGYDLIMCDVTPRQLLRLAGDRFTHPYRRLLEKFRYGPGVFKLDYALSAPVPWTAKECARAATVHLAGTFEDISASEDAVYGGRRSSRPFIIVAQPSLFDPTRAPQGQHVLWAYCHVPNSSTEDMVAQMEDQIERFAPGFRDCVLARNVLTPLTLERMDSNLVGGDIGGGAMDLGQFLSRPTQRLYSTTDPNIYICSSSTPPGGGVHGMCGYHAAQAALSRLRRHNRRRG